MSARNRESRYDWGELIPIGLFLAAFTVGAGLTMGVGFVLSAFSLLDKLTGVIVGALL